MGPLPVLLQPDRRLDGERLSGIVLLPGGELSRLKRYPDLYFKVDVTSRTVHGEVQNDNPDPFIRPVTPFDLVVPHIAACSPRVILSSFPDREFDPYRFDPDPVLVDVDRDSKTKVVVAEFWKASKHFDEVSSEVTFTSFGPKLRFDCPTELSET